VYLTQKLTLEEITAAFTVGPKIGIGRRFIFMKNDSLGAWKLNHLDA